MKNLYTEILLDYFKSPRNHGALKNPTVSGTAYGNICGDKIQIDLLLDKNGEVKKATFESDGCATSQAYASMLTEKLIGKTLEEIKNIKESEISKLFNIPINPQRAECPLISLRAAKNATTSSLHQPH